MSEQPTDLTRTTLAILFIAGLLMGCFWILGPFLPSMVWAATLVIATWPILVAIQARLWGSRSLATLIMTTAILCVFIVPFWLAIGTIVKHADLLSGWGSSLASFKVPPPPAWLAELPMVGQAAEQAWTAVADSGVNEWASYAAPYAGKATQWFVSAAGSVGLLFLEALLTVMLAAIMYSSGDAAGAMAHKFGHRLAGARGEQAVRLIGQAIRGVALGVVVTAAVQTLIGGVALAIAGVPLADILSAVMLLFCIAQAGPGPVLIPAVIWLYMSGSTAWGTFLLVCSIVVIGLDNVLRPILIRRGADLPLLLILAGVIGGLMAFGLVGIFLGPAVLAVSYTLLQAWLQEDMADETPAA